MMSDIVSYLVREAARVERDRLGKALTDDEARTLRDVGFLRQIAPYLFEPAPQAVSTDDGPEAA